MITELNCQSATRVKDDVFYYIHAILHTVFNACHVCMWPCFIHFCYAKVALPELPEEPHQPVLTFLRDILIKRNLCTAVSRASGLAAKCCWLYYDEAQGVIFCFICVL